MSYVESCDKITLRLHEANFFTLCRVFPWQRHFWCWVKSSAVYLQFLACLAQLPPPMNITDILWLSCFSCPLLRYTHPSHTVKHSEAVLWYCAQGFAECHVIGPFVFVWQCVTFGEATRQFSHDSRHREEPRCNSKEGKITHQSNLSNLLLMKSSLYKQTLHSLNVESVGKVGRSVYGEGPGFWL